MEQKRDIEQKAQQKYKDWLQKKNREKIEKDRREKVMWNFYSYFSIYEKIQILMT